MSSDSGKLEHQDPVPEKDKEVENKKPDVDTDTGLPKPEPLTGDETPEEIARKLSFIIDAANERIKPLLGIMKQALDKAKSDKEHDCLNEEALVKQVRPLVEQSTNVLFETQGAIKALDPDGSIANSALRKSSDHEASKEEQHLAESLGFLTGDVTKAIEEAKDTIKDMPNVKKDLGPLLDMMSGPLFQIVSGIGLLLNGVLSLLGNILDGLGLGGIVRNILAGLGLEKVLKGLGLTGLFPSEKDTKKKAAK